jgi:hypothetical protein
MGALTQDEGTHVRVLSEASKAGWHDCGPGIHVKVLAVDPVKHSVEYLARTPPGHSTGLHRHHAEAYIFVVEGSVKNVTTGCEYRAGMVLVACNGYIESSVSTSTVSGHESNLEGNRHE